jgi:hypothetical protein
MIHKDVTRWCHADAHTAAGDGRAHNSTPGVPPAAVAVVAPQTRLLLHVSEPLHGRPSQTQLVGKKTQERERDTHARRSAQRQQVGLATMETVGATEEEDSRLVRKRKQTETSAQQAHTARRLRAHTATLDACATYCSTIE